MPTECSHCRGVFLRKLKHLNLVSLKPGNLQRQWADWWWCDHLSPEDAPGVPQWPLHSSMTQWVCVCMCQCECEGELCVTFEKLCHMSLENPAYSSATIWAYSDVWCNVFFSQLSYLKICIALTGVERYHLIQCGDSFISNLIFSCCSYF